MAAAEGYRQVLVAETLQLRVAVRPDHRDKLMEIDLLRQFFEKVLVALMRTAVEVPDRSREVARRDVVLVVEDTAAQDIEEHVRIMMRCDCFLGRHLEPVCGSHDACEFVIAHIDGSGYGIFDVGLTAQPVAQLYDPGLRLLHVGNDTPLP